MASAATFIAEDGVEYQDKKRYLWLYSLLVPLVAIMGPVAYLLTGQLVFLWSLIAVLYVVGPVVDTLLGEDTSNPPESLVPQLEADPYYRNIVVLHVPLLWAIFLFNAWFVSTAALPWYGYLCVAITSGLISGFSLNVGHELGHKKTTLERWLAKIILAPLAYGHFFIEHNKGHHRDVATPEDPASSRMGESLYRFACREIPGGVRRAWRLEQQRLDREGKGWWTLDNEILQPLLITIVSWGGLIVFLGPVVIPFLLLNAMFGWWQLTLANYIEHYGLLRKKLDNGRYEQCQPHHSWNSNHLFSNWLVFHLQRHSDHHAHAARRYQSLRHFSTAPALPSGYFVMFLFAYIPPLWQRVMNPRLIAAVDGDVKKINFLASKRQQLIQRYQLADTV